MKMILLAALTTPLAGWAQEDFTVTGNVKGVNPPAMAYLVYQTTTGNVMDSVMVIDGKFTFQGAVLAPTEATLVLTHKGEVVRQMRNPDMRSLYLEKGDITVSSEDSLIHASINGGPANQDFLAYQMQVNESNKEVQEIMRPYMEASEEERQKPDFSERTQAAIASVREKQKNVDFNFINEHPSSPVSLNLLISYVGTEPIKDVVEPTFNKLSAELKNSVKGKAVVEKMETLKTVDIGSIAPDFTHPDTAGTPVALSSLRGKYVLIDFWASWCGPCRNENPNVVAAYQAYKDKNFTVLGVSVDSPGSKDAWLKAIKEDGLQGWPQLHDVGESEGQPSAGSLFAVETIPTNFLLDPEGRIIAKNLRGAALQAELAKLLN